MDEALTVAALGAGVIGNLTTNVVQKVLSSLPKSALKRRLTSLGLAQPTFEERLEHATNQAFQDFFQQNPRYNLPQVVQFLRSDAVATELAQAFSRLSEPDLEVLKLHLSYYMGVAEEFAPEGWPNAIDPTQLVDSLISAFQRALLKTGDPAFLTIAQQLVRIESAFTNITSQIEAIAISSSDKAKYSSFERSYKNYIAQRFSRLTTPGARELQGIKQDLSIAYISLNLKSTDQVKAVKAEDYLSNQKEISIRGPAGSGKTTLLNWMATRCNDPDRTTQWSDLVPFVIPLRKLARIESGAPKVNRFIDYSTDERLWTSETPSGWIENILKVERRGVVMIDGVDELPSSRRAEFWDWLEEFAAEFEGNRIILTSRTLPGMGQAHGDWRPPARFKDAELMEMSDADITAFIEHWHDAIDLAKLEPDEKVRLSDARDTLPVKLRDPANRRIRELCSTPLLCAMVCVLHWREEGYLPRYRVELYERCCEMLIEARDLKRDIVPPVGPLGALTRHDKEMALQHVALSMMQSRPDGDDEADATYRVEVQRDVAKLWIDKKIVSFQSEEARSADPEQVLDFLIERTGLLREPAVGLIDFPHRTFQEYLAACAAGAESLEDMLALKADDDQWHETIMLAAGTTTGGVSFGRRLIEALLRRAARHKSAKDRSVRVRKTCLALSLGCLDSLKQHDPALREKVLSHIAALIPPHNDADAKILAVAGDAVVPYLRYADICGHSPPVVAACARALRQVGTDQAIDTLKAYVVATVPGVLAELVATDRILLTSIPAISSFVEERGLLPSYVQLQNLEMTRGLKGLNTITIRPGTVGLDVLSDHEGLEKISAESRSLSGFVPYVTGENIRKVTQLRGAADIHDWAGSMPNIESLTLLAPDTPVDATVLAQFGKLGSISMRSGQVENFHLLSRSQSLRHLDLSECKISGDNSISPCLELKSIHLERNDCYFDLATLVDSQTDVESISLADSELAGRISFGKPHLEHLHIAFDSSISELRGIESAARLETLSLMGLPNLRELVPLFGVESVRSLRLASLQIRDLEGLKQARALETLELLHAQYVHEIDDVSELKSLDKIAIVDCYSLKRLPEYCSARQVVIHGTHESIPIRQLVNYENMTSLELFNNAPLEGVEMLSACPKLSHLSIRSEDSLPSLKNLAKIVNLRVLEIGGIDGDTDLSPLKDLPNLEQVTLMLSDGRPSIPKGLSAEVLFTTYYYYDERFDYYSDRPSRFSRMKSFYR